MEEYNEEKAKKELENLFNELFVSDLNTKIQENYSKSEELCKQMKAELRELIDEYLPNKVETTINEIKVSNDSALSGVREESTKLLKSYEYNFTEFELSIRKMKQRINILALVISISFIAAVLYYSFL